MATVSISEKGQVTLPAKARRELGLRPRSKLEVEITKDSIILRPIKSIMDLSGILHEYA